MGVSFDLFGTLVSADRSADPASAVAAELLARDVSVPDDWDDAYARPHLEVAAGRELPLPDHVVAALESRGVEADPTTVRQAVQAAFDRAVTTRPGACEAVAAASECGPVAICSNCSVPGLVERTLERSRLDSGAFDAVVTSVDCGWRKPAPEIFETTAARLGVESRDLVHVGDDPRADGGVEALGGTYVSLEDVTLASVPVELEAIDG
ncbi:HAD family hydrolase [Natrialbaceae archaeon AArc-T1-2]|uniref:HAD family hydrolase n=1 Tax=Natrialbaceae archaeon AArc-T1-2 TaxID=3053904 RepID=UPI00255A9F11|nr:HAD family hydrolase [Natrialbaceae archaeon AArc-T1-2]WIV65834.1 HAD family hydrolase [Natrialbaceae archaeon AArc-T1-2]